MVRSAAVLFVVALLFNTASVAQQPSFGGRNGPLAGPGHPWPGYPPGYRDPRPGGLPGLVPGLLLGLGVGMIPFIQPPAPARVAPGGYPQQPSPPQGRTAPPPGSP